MPSPFFDSLLDGSSGIVVELGGCGRTGGKCRSDALTSRDDTPSGAPELASMEPVRVTVGTAYQDGVFTVGFADDDGASALLFSRSDTIDEQDALLGIDTYSISTDDGATFYGGVASARVDG